MPFRATEEEFTTRVSIFFWEKRKGNAGNEAVGEATKIVEKGPVKEVRPEHRSPSTRKPEGEMILLVTTTRARDPVTPRQAVGAATVMDGGGETIWKGKTMEDARGLSGSSWHQPARRWWSKKCS